MWKWVGLDRIVAGWIKVQISRSPGVRSRNCNFFTMCQRTPLSSWQWREPVCDPGGETGMEGGGSSLWIPEIPSRNFSGKPFSSLIRLLSVEWSPEKNGNSRPLWCVVELPKMSSSTTRWCSKQTTVNCRVIKQVSCSVLGKISIF